jgi:Fe(3+) dicitrate transport protein
MSTRLFPNPLHAALLCVLASSVAQARSEATADADADSGLRTLATIQVVEKNAQGQPAEGSSTVLDQSVLVSGRALTVNEALRKVPGVTVRDEEGFGLRPNIGIRGSNPTRSTKVLLLEDGLPAMYAPYGDNASYYHAPIQRYDRIEVLKGAGLLRFGPQTITGAINYITPDPPLDPAGHVQLSAGTRGFVGAHASVGASGFLFDLGHKQGDGARDNTALEQTDLFAKYSRHFGDSHALTVRANHLQETSQVGYSGITDAEYARFGAEYYPFLDDLFDISHNALSLSHAFTPSEGTQLLSSLYYSSFDRDWWRQSSTTSDTQCGTAFRDARYRGERVDPRACNSAQGRLRGYETWGLDTRYKLPRSLIGSTGSTEFGLRWHEEEQDRLQVNGTAPAARTGNLAESNFRTTDALSGFITSTFDFGRLQLTPSLRREDIDFSRQNRLPGGAFGEDGLAETLWGLGMNYAFAGGTSVYASAHEGFAPPRVEDLIAGNGSSTEVDAESSTNLELGLRARLGRIDLETTAFRSDFDNQIAVGSIAGGSTPLAQGKTEYAGLELAVGLNRQALQSRAGEWYANLAATWLATADQSSVLRRVDNAQAVAGSQAGNRLPYAPEFTFTGRIGFAHGAWDMNLELQHVGRQWADFANTRLPAVNGDGQFGQLDSHAVWSATLNYEPDTYGWSAFLAIKNLTDEEYIVDRTRGILFGNPRQFVLGARYAW